MAFSWDKAYRTLETRVVFEDVVETVEILRLACTNTAYVQIDWCFEVKKMSCKNVTFFHTE